MGSRSHTVVVPRASSVFSPSCPSSSTTSPHRPAKLGKTFRPSDDSSDDSCRCSLLDFPLLEDTSSQHQGATSSLIALGNCRTTSTKILTRETGSAASPSRGGAFELRRIELTLQLSHSSQLSRPEVHTLHVGLQVSQSDGKTGSAAAVLVAGQPDGHVSRVDIDHPINRQKNTLQSCRQTSKSLGNLLF
eukprot:Selendium_serpulae@DN6386_c3_g2_i1.p1